jgi:hypothetical protein
MALQEWLAGQLPHVPPQPSAPHAFPLHAGAQAHAPDVQAYPLGQLPHEPPQPSSPHAFPEHTGVQASQARG